MNLHVKELVDVIMWTIDNFEKNTKRAQIMLFP